MLFRYDLFSLGIVKHKFILNVKQKVRMYHKVLKAHTLVDSNILKFK
jgi:hypothetical protein